jgi:hypothetical protein
LKNSLILETFILCPNTIYTMGSYVFDEIEGKFKVVGGYETIYPRANSIIQCGADGKSSNNCTLRGGQYQLWNSYVSYTAKFLEDKVKVGVVIKGLTFEAAVESNLVLTNEGDITFIDCVFQVSDSLLGA